MESVSRITTFWQKVEEEAAHISQKVAKVAREAISFVYNYDYRTSALYGSSLPLALPITLIGIIQCIRDLVNKAKKEAVQTPHRIALAITDLVVGISGLVRPFCITVIALSVISKIDPIVHAAAGPLSLVASIFNSFYALSVIIRAVISCKKMSAMHDALVDEESGSHGKTPYHYLADKANASRKELGYDFQANGTEMRSLFTRVAGVIDHLDGETKAGKSANVTQLFNKRMVHRRVSDALSIVIAIASIVSAVCFFVWAGTFLAPVAWIVALAVCAMSLGKYLYDRKIIHNFKSDLERFIQSESARPID
jgi:hypothetical protein